MFDTFKALFAFFRTCIQLKRFSWFPLLKPFCMFYRTPVAGFPFSRAQSRFHDFLRQKPFSNFPALKLNWTVICAEAVGTFFHT